MLTTCDSSSQTIESYKAKPTARPKTPIIASAVTLAIPPVWVVVEATMAEALVPVAVAVADVLFDDVFELVVVEVSDSEDESVEAVLLALVVEVSPLAGVYAPVSLFPLSPLSPT